MAAVKGVYDPIKAVEGMFNGSVTRIAYALKDPTDYGESTKTVLAECAKRFHDALDDCEIQLLDAKWYLEQQLRTNRSQREAKAREMGTAAKRKHDEIKDANEQVTIEETTAKKAKLEPKVEQKESPAESEIKSAAIEVKPTQKNGTTSTTETTKPTETPQTPSPKPVEIENNKESQPKQPTAQPTKAVKPPAKELIAPDDFAKPTPQATPTGTNDDFNFESMFGEPANDLAANNGKDNNELNFDFFTEDLAGPMDDTGNQDPTSLDSLLPGLESYANQTDDPFMNIDPTDNLINTEQNKPSMQDVDALPSFSNDFDLPDLGTNVFDDLLNDDSLGVVDAGGNFEDGIDLSDAALLDMDFDSFQ